LFVFAKLFLSLIL